MGTMPLLERIEARRQGRGEPVPRLITERMSEFSRRLAEKRLPVKGWLHDGCGPDGRSA
ncbi:MAG: hypothetical protein M3N43_14765 [Actinomycetota bacterium]|nr:hypothetical protein [Actinomycetota bacterium]